MALFDKLLSEGWTKKMAKVFVDTFALEYSIPCYQKDYIDWAHNNGFFAETAYCLNLTEKNIGNYVSDYTYHKIWPLNNWARIWINDKLTLKQIMAGTEFDSFMPRYYFYSTPNGLLPLMDSNIQDKSFESFISILKQEERLACKPCNGQRSAGFYKIAYINKNFMINDRVVSTNDLYSFISFHSNYLFTEYLKPSEQFSIYSDKIQTLRIVVKNEDGINPSIIGGYLRLPCSGEEANYQVLDGTDNSYNLFTDIDFHSGRFFNAYKTYADKSVPILRHPITNAVIEGIIQDYEILADMVINISKRLNMLEFIGFDIGISDNGFKCMEINSFPGTKYMQLFHPMKNDPKLKEYFERKEGEINSLSDHEKRIRNSIIR